VFFSEDAWEEVSYDGIFANGQPNSQFGQLTSTLQQTPNRQIQLALKLIW